MSNWNPQIGLSIEERRLAEKYARRFGLVDAVLRIRRGMKHRPRLLYILGYDKDQIKYRVSFNQAKKMIKPTSYNVATEYRLKYFIMRAKEIHGNKYDYSLVELADIIKLRVKVPIICNTDGHGVFMQTKENHVLDIRGCPKCAKKRLKARWITSSKKE